MRNTWNVKSFAEWKRLVDAECVRQCGMSTDDLPDCDYASWHEDGIHPERAAKRAIRNAEEN